MSIDSASSTEPRRTSDAAAGVAAQRSDFISFAIGDEQYGVDIMAVREIKGWSSVTHLPNQPEYVRGVLNLRGVMVPIVDLRCRFGQGNTETTPLHVVIIVQIDGRQVGLLADRVLDIVSFEPSQVQPVPRIANGLARQLPLPALSRSTTPCWRWSICPIFYRYRSRMASRPPSTLNPRRRDEYHAPPTLTKRQHLEELDYASTFQYPHRHQARHHVGHRRGAGDRHDRRVDVRQFAGEELERRRYEATGNLPRRRRPPSALPRSTKATSRC